MIYTPVAVVRLVKGVGYLNKQKEVGDMKNLTELEREVVKVLREPNGNGTEIDNKTRDYLSLFWFDIDSKILRGVLSSLVKKNIIEIGYDQNDWGAEAWVRFTDEGYQENA